MCVYYICAYLFARIVFARISLRILYVHVLYLRVLYVRVLYLRVLVCARKIVVSSLNYQPPSPPVYNKISPQKLPVRRIDGIIQQILMGGKMQLIPNYLEGSFLVGENGAFAFPRYFVL